MRRAAGALSLFVGVLAQCAVLDGAGLAMAGADALEARQSRPPASPPPQSPPGEGQPPESAPATPAPAPAVPPSAVVATPLSRFGWLSDLAGSCWAGTRPGGEASDTQCYQVQFGRFLRGTIEMPARGGAAGFRGDSVFAWDEKTRSIAYWVWGSDGAFSPGEAFVEGDVIRFPPRRREGATGSEIRSSWTRLDQNSFKVVRERKEGESWTEVLSVLYRRAGTQTK